MIWEKIQVKNIILGEKDRLGNPKKTYSSSIEITARITQWTAEDVNLYGRELTKTTRKLLTPSKSIWQNTVVIIKKETYRVVDIMDLGRFRLAFIERYNHEI